jgi:hypothetical protein
MEDFEKMGGLFYVGSWNKSCRAWEVTAGAHS